MACRLQAAISQGNIVEKCASNRAPIWAQLNCRCSISVSGAGQTQAPNFRYPISPPIGDAAFSFAHRARGRAWFGGIQGTPTDTSRTMEKCAFGRTLCAGRGACCQCGSEDTGSCWDYRLLQSRANYTTHSRPRDPLLFCIGNHHTENSSL